MLFIKERMCRCLLESAVEQKVKISRKYMKWSADKDFKVQLIMNTKGRERGRNNYQKFKVNIFTVF